MTHLETILAAARTALAAVTDTVGLEQVKARYLGKSGELTELLKQLGKLPPEERKTAGAAINETKQAFEAAFNARRDALAADKLAAMVTDPLITHAIAARQRGLAILGAAGPQYNVRLDLPVLTGIGQPGVFDVGQLVQINATVPWRGRVKAVSVNAKRPSLRQSVTLERHLEAA